MGESFEETRKKNRQGVGGVERRKWVRVCWGAGMLDLTECCREKGRNQNFW